MLTYRVTYPDGFQCESQYRVDAVRAALESVASRLERLSLMDFELLVQNLQLLGITIEVIEDG